MVTRSGDEVYYCAECGWIRAPNGYTGVCPVCHSPMKVMRCNRCMHVWWPKKNSPPRVCPRCKSPYWNRTRSRSLIDRGDDDE